LRLLSPITELMSILDEENFYFESEWIVPFDQLYECVYLGNIFLHLKELLGKDFYNYQFIYYASNGASNPPKPLVLTDPRPKILIWSGDETSIAPAYMAKYFKVIFKTFLNGDKNLNSYYHFPMGYTKNVLDLEVIPILDRSNNVFFSGNLNSNRIDLYKSMLGINFLDNRVIEKLKKSRLNSFLPVSFNTKYKNSYIGFTSGFAKGLDGTAYSNYLYNSKLIICPTGFTSNETFRHYETWRTGGIPISLPMPDNYFYRGAPIVTIQNWRELDKTIKRLLQSPNLLVDLHEKSKAWWANKCDEKQVAKYMFDLIKQ
jgi:hypothetical protein